jgi:hypothetical protein
MEKTQDAWVFSMIVERPKWSFAQQNLTGAHRVTPSPVGVMIQTTPITMEQFYLITLQSSANEDFPERSF